MLLQQSNSAPSGIPTHAIATPRIAHDAANVYTDVNGLQSIRQLGKQDKSAALMEVAKQFESMFLKMMLSSMRDANQVFKEDSLFSSSESDFYENMYDDQITLSLSASQSTGLADVIYRQMLSNYNTGGSTGTSVDANGKPQPRPEINHSELRRHYSSLQRTVEKVDDALAEIEQQSTHSGTPAANAVASGKGVKGQQFATPTDFVAALYPHAQQVGQQLNVDPKAIVAQAALETGWGKHMIADEQGNNSFNFFGIKADQRWQGSRVNIVTHEYRSGVRVNERADFRAYESIEAGLNDYARFLQTGERYQQAVGKGLAGDQYGHALQQAGYATDPAYGEKIKRVSGSDTLLQALNKLQPATAQ